jgi:hypothetical protein
MNLFTLEISRDWLTPIGVALVLLSFCWFCLALRLRSDRFGFSGTITPN